MATNQYIGITPKFMPQTIPSSTQLSLFSRNPNITQVRHNDIKQTIHVLTQENFLKSCDPFNLEIPID